MPILHAEWLVNQALFFCIRKGSMFMGRDELIIFADFSLDLGSLARQRRLMDGRVHEVAAAIAQPKFPVDNRRRSRPDHSYILPSATGGARQRGEWQKAITGSRLLLLTSLTGF